MCAPCSLPRNLQIRIKPIGTVLLCRHGERHPVQGIRASDGFQSGILEQDGWMFINHPQEGIGLVGLPLCGKSNSWQSAFEDMRADLYFRTPDTRKWTELERWEDLPLSPVRP